jgi:thiosulfate/3-mercaptopyruvate sulfurtransferase
MIEPIVTGRRLDEQPEVVLADVRWYADGRDGRAAYDAGHLPGAVFVDL